jgi:uncharacterized protein
MLTSFGHKTLPLASLALAILVCAGCARSPQRSYYSLQGPAPQPTRHAAFTPDQMQVVVGPVTLPETVDRPQMVTRSGANRLEINDLHRWAQPLSGEIAAVLAADLYRDLGQTTLVGIQGQEAAAHDPAYRVVLDIERFEAVLGQAATVQAAWSIRHKGAEAPIHGRTLARAPVTDASHDALAAAYAQALRRVSREIAAALPVR